MELITKILSSNFFAIYSDMIKITNTWNVDVHVKEKLDFNTYVKKRLILLSKFQFKPIKNFNLSLCLRLQFLLQYHLVACLDEKSLQVYSQYLCKENKKLLFSIIQNEKNFEVIMRELHNRNYVHLEFLIEVFYALKCNIELFIKIQSLLNNLGFMDFLCGLISQIEFRSVDQMIFLEIKNDYFSQKKNFLNLLEIIMFFIYKNKNCFILKIFPNSSTTNKSAILKFLSTLPFQSTFEKSNTFVLRILEIIVTNMNELVEEPEMYRHIFAETLAEVIEQYSLQKYDNFFMIVEMLINNKENNTLKILSKRLDMWSPLIGSMQLSKGKAVSTTKVKIAGYLLNNLDLKPPNFQFIQLMKIWIGYLKKNKYNVLSSCMFESLQNLHEKSDEYIKKIMPSADYMDLARFLRPTVAECL